MTTTLQPPAASSVGLLDVEAVSKILNCSTRHTFRLSEAKKMPAPVKLGALRRWSSVAIDEWIAAGCPPCEDGNPD